MSIGCDNAANMNVMLNKLSNLLLEKDINFDPDNQHVRCLAHIINLAAKKTLENLYEFNMDDFNELDECQAEEEEEVESSDIIYKVNIQFYRKYA